MEGKTWGLHVDGYSGYVGVTDNLGLNERRKHIEAIKVGKTSYVVMCIGDPEAEPGGPREARPRRLACALAPC